MKPSTETVFFKSTDGLTLEGELAFPPFSPTAKAIIAHPHSLYGGSMYNNVVAAFWHGLTQQGFLTLRFNFRGVNNSEGTFDEGKGETHDLHGAIRFLQERKPEKIPFYLIGYSFGAYVVHNAIPFPPLVKGTVFVSPPNQMLPFDFAQSRHVPPLLILAGDRDSFCNVNQLKSWRTTYPARLSLQIFKGTDHFWIGKERLLLEHFQNWLETLDPE